MAANVHSLRPVRHSTETRTFSTCVRDVQDGVFLLEDPACPQARQAYSCLIEPRAGDTVLLSHDPAQDGGHILAILERPGPQDSSLNLPGGGHIHSRDCEVCWQTRSLQLAGRETLSLQTGHLDVAAVSANTTVKHWQGWFDTLEAHAVRIEYAAKTLSSKVGRLLSRALESFRSVDGLDETRAGRSRTTVRDDHRLKAGHITAQAKGFVKIDGQKIDLG